MSIAPPRLRCDQVRKAFPGVLAFALYHIRFYFRVVILAVGRALRYE